MKKKSNITAYLEVFNEEARIESCLRSLSWVDELIVFDKQSTDRTVEIAKEYATKVINVPYCDGSENIPNNISNSGTSEWVLFVTASNLFHPNLVDRILRLTSDAEFSYDVIALPYKLYSFGVYSRNSPFGSKRKCSLIRKSALVLSKELHKEISFNTDKIFNMPLLDGDEVLFHCTHVNANDFFEKVLRYTKYEATFDDSLPDRVILKNTLMEIFKAFGRVIFRRRSLMLGWDGLALSFAYLVYFLIKFIYVWDVRMGRGGRTYSDLRKKIDLLWESKNFKK